MMRHSHGARWLVPVLCVLVAAAAPSDDAGGASSRRLTIDPATFAPIPAKEAQERAEGRSRTLLRKGPRIRLRRPHDHSVFRVDETVAMQVDFLPAFDGSVPDMSTLNVRVRQGWFGRDITEMVEAFVEGDAIHVPAIDFLGHTGTFRFAIRIKDHLSRESEVEFRVSIVSTW